MPEVKKIVNKTVQKIHKTQDDIKHFRRQKKRNNLEITALKLYVKHFLKLKSQSK